MATQGTLLLGGPNPLWGEREDCGWEILPAVLSEGKECDQCQIFVATVYHPGSESVQSAFFDELADLLDAVAMRAEPVYLVGDLNIRLDRADDAYAVRLVDLLGGYGLNIQVSVSTHQLGVAATRRDLAAPEVKIVNVG